MASKFQVYYTQNAERPAAVAVGKIYTDYHNLVCRSAAIAIALGALSDLFEAGANDDEIAAGEAFVIAAHAAYVPPSNGAIPKG